MPPSAPSAETASGRPVSAAATGTMSAAIAARMTSAVTQPTVPIITWVKGSNRNWPTEPPVAATPSARLRPRPGKARATAESTSGKPQALTAAPMKTPAPRCRLASLPPRPMINSPAT